MSQIDEILSFDKDGALRETAEEAVESRADFLRKVGIGAGAVVAGGAFAGALPAVAKGAIPASDVAILNFALTLEFLEAEFYAKAVASGKLTGEPREFARIVAQHEKSHELFLKKVLGSKAVARPRFDFKGTTEDQAKFIATADALENLGVHAYLGQVANIKTKAVLVGAGRILPVEARHAAWIRAIRYDQRKILRPQVSPAPAGFEDPYTKARVLAAVKATGFIVG